MIGCLPLLLLLALPIAEVWAFVAVGRQVGWLESVLALVAAGMLGGAIVRTQGLATGLRLREALARGEAPGRVLFDGACRLAAGVLLMVPGFLTDAVAILLLLPPVRWLTFRLALGKVRVVHHAPPPRSRPARPRGGVIDAEWSEVPEEGQDDQRALPPGDGTTGGDGSAGGDSSKTRT